ncbi:MAG: Cys-tRNA(Pro) deacylase [Eubacteriales bacterium]|nr:Cys-tRNA(Pro) deacylase [Eubacteriales bacterium]
MDKTNVMRLLDAAGLPYKAHAYAAPNGALSGTEVALQLHQDPTCVFKTLVTVGASGKHYVFVIPVAEELSLKKAATAVKEKSIEMLKSKELLPLTGYIHGGCSPIGMKKPFPTVLDETVILCETMLFSAGKIGFQIEMRPEDLQKIVPYQAIDVTI